MFEKFKKNILGKPFILYKKRKFDKDIRIIETLDIELVSHCNLNCKSCTHFSPIASKEYLSVKEFEQDLRQLSAILGKRIKCINLLGGEPLLHKEVTLFMKIARKYFGKAKIVLLTNGILLLEQKANFWNTAREQNIVVEVTKYPIDLDYKKIQERAKMYEVKFHFYGRSGYVQKTQYLLPIICTGNQNAEENFKKCFMARSCITLYHGKLFPCSYAAYMERFNTYFDKRILVVRKDYADIYEDSFEEIMKTLSYSVPMCRYCDVSKRQYGNRWTISNKKLCEWCNEEGENTYSDDLEYGKHPKIEE